ncbi:MAG: glycosyltransferase, partial [Pyrinomonadaceae bacterium]
MTFSVCFVERRPGKYVSLEKAFRSIAADLSDRYSYNFVQIPFSSRVYNAIANLLFFRPKQADIYQVTGDPTYIALRLPPERTVLSIMDLRFVNMNTGIRRFILKKLFLDLPLRRHRYVTAISANVRDEIVALTGCDPDKIRILDLPLMSHFRANRTKEFDAVKPVILQVGTIANKNVPNLVRALNGLSCKLIVVGELDNELLEALESNSIDYENSLSLSNEGMCDAYEKADIVTFCSTYEGFGLPIIEGQMMRKPVITSDLSPMKDTAGIGACLVDPYDPVSIRNGIQRVIDNAEYRESLVEAGVKNAMRFESKAVASQYERLY